MSAEWRKMTDGEKSSYGKMAANDKVRYEKEKKAYDAKNAK